MWSRHGPSLVHRGRSALQDLTRYCRVLVDMRTTERQWLANALKDAVVKLSSGVEDHDRAGFGIATIDP